MSMSENEEARKRIQDGDTEKFVEVLAYFMREKTKRLKDLLVITQKLRELENMDLETFLNSSYSKGRHYGE